MTRPLLSLSAGWRQYKGTGRGGGDPNNAGEFHLSIPANRVKSRAGYLRSIHCNAASELFQKYCRTCGPLAVKICPTLSVRRVRLP